MGLPKKGLFCLLLLLRCTGGCNAYTPLSSPGGFGEFLALGIPNCTLAAFYYSCPPGTPARLSPMAWSSHDAAAETIRLLLADLVALTQSALQNSPGVGVPAQDWFATFLQNSAPLLGAILGCTLWLSLRVSPVESSVSQCHSPSVFKVERKRKRPKRVTLRKKILVFALDGGCAPAAGLAGVGIGL